MTSPEKTAGDELRSIARLAMLERGLLPEFSAATIPRKTSTRRSTR